MKANFQPRCHIEPERVRSNTEHAKTLGLPYVGKAPRKPLAVVGGGHSVKDHIQELQAWPGDIWACGTSFQWCKANGIDAALFCIDPGPGLNAAGVKRAILATCSDPSLFEDLKDADVQVFDLECSEGRANYNCTTMTAAPELATRMGYVETSFFGGDSCFPDSGPTHVTHDVPVQLRFPVRVGRKYFNTCAEFLMQAEFLAHAIRMFPGLYKDRSGGLLGAMVEDLDYDIDERLAA